MIGDVPEAGGEQSGSIQAMPVIPASSDDPSVGLGKPMCHGEMSELAEGARLEIVCTPKRCTEGSNPSLSATILVNRATP
jgi:hypothetical protein